MRQWVVGVAIARRSGLAVQLGSAVSMVWALTEEDAKREVARGVAELYPPGDRWEFSFTIAPLPFDGVTTSPPFNPGLDD